MSRADVHAALVRACGAQAVAISSAAATGGPSARSPWASIPDDDDCLIKAVKDPQRLHLIVAGGLGPITAVCHGWNESSRAVHGYELR